MALETRGQALGGRLCLRGEGDGRAGTVTWASKRRSLRAARSLASPFCLRPDSSPSCDLRQPQLWRSMWAKGLRGKNQLTNEHNTTMLELTNNHGNGPMMVRSSGNVLNKEKMWLEDTFSSNWKVECHP